MNFFDDYFVYSSSEKKGILILLLILLSLIIAYYLIPYFLVPEKEDFSQIKTLLIKQEKQYKQSQISTHLFKFNPNTITKDSLLLLGLTSKQTYNIINYRTKVGKFKNAQDFNKIYSLSDSLKKSLAPFIQLESKTKNSGFSPKKERKDSLFEFNPNEISKEEFIQLGFSNSEAKTILNYRNKGGKFYKKEDFKKIYSVSEKKYKELQSFIKINESKSLSEEKDTLVIEINTANSSDFEKVRGIGTVISVNIIKYRNKLGGFYSINQLKEVYGLDKSNVIEDNKQKFILDKSHLIKINLNKSTFKELVNHPYLTYNDTKKIFNFRKMHGEFDSMEQIIGNNLINPKQYRKIAPYLTLE